MNAPVVTFSTADGGDIADTVRTLAAQDRAAAYVEFRRRHRNRRRARRWLLAIALLAMVALVLSEIH